jgi:hypothetical protein
VPTVLATDDENDNKSTMEYCWNDDWQGTTEILGEKPVSVPLSTTNLS